MLNIITSSTPFKFFFFLFLLAGITAESHGQSPAAPSNLQTLGTRTWVRINWQDNASNETGYKIYWSTSNSQPASPGATVAANITRYYIQPVTAGTTYYIWVVAYNASGSSSAISTSATAITTWSLDTAEVNHLSIPSSVAVPAGMQLFWQDEFNDAFLNRNKWSTNYYSTVDFYNGSNLSAMNNDTLPQPAFLMTGNSIQLLVNDTMPAKNFSPARKISSIQTYDWHSNEQYLDDRRGGYYEVRVRRSNTPNATTGLNMAYWFDSPGPDLKYWMEQGNALNGVTGVRPHGQAFEIDVFEEDDDAVTSTTTPFTLHGNVAADGTFQSHLATYNASLSSQNNWATHGLLWTPAGISYYINGVLQTSWNNTSSNMAPNHFMNILLGAYYGWTQGMTNNATLEVDYIRGYQWPVVNGNELPNPGFEYGTLQPWTGTGSLSTSSKRSGNAGAVLTAGQTLVQYVFLDNSNNYQLKYWSQGSGTVRAQIENLTQVTGVTQSTYSKNTAVGAGFLNDSLSFATSGEFGNNMKTIRVTFTNTGSGTVTLDDIVLQKGGAGGSPSYCTAAGGSSATDRYITSLTTSSASHNIGYSGTAYPANGYGLDTADSIAASPGSSFTLNMTNSPNTKWARVEAYADWKGDGSFTDAGDTLFLIGSPNQDNSATVLNISRLITVPAGAKAGHTRMRVRFFDAWIADPGPCGQVNFTTTQDFMLVLPSSPGGLAGSVSRMNDAGNGIGGSDSLLTGEGRGDGVYPNGFANSLNLKFNSPKDQSYSVRLFNTDGKLLISKTFNLNKGSNTITLDNLGHLTQGIYLLRVTGDGQTRTFKVLKK